LQKSLLRRYTPRNDSATDTFVLYPAEADLYEPLLSGAAAILGDRRDTIGGAGGMEVIIEPNDSFCFSRICGKIVALLHHYCGTGATGAEIACGQADALLTE
jgi:hypothetical protein